MTRKSGESTDLESVVEAATSIKLCTSRTCTGAGRAIGRVPPKGGSGSSGTRGDRLGLGLGLWLELEDVAEGLGSLCLNSGGDALDVEMQQIGGKLWDHR
jgi:hypothetical protein